MVVSGEQAVRLCGVLDRDRRESWLHDHRGSLHRQSKHHRPGRRTRPREQSRRQRICDLISDPSSPVYEGGEGEGGLGV